MRVVLEGARAGQQLTSCEPRLVKAAHEFEAQLMKELLKPLTSNGEDEAGAGSEGALSDFAGEALGGRLSEGGGFGIARSVIRSLSRNENLRSISTESGTRAFIGKGSFK